MNYKLFKLKNKIFDFLWKLLEWSLRYILKPIVFIINNIDNLMDKIDFSNYNMNYDVKKLINKIYKYSYPKDDNEIIIFSFRDENCGNYSLFYDIYDSNILNEEFRNRINNILIKNNFEIKEMYLRDYFIKIYGEERRYRFEEEYRWNKDEIILIVYNNNNI